MKRVEFVRIQSQICGFGLGKGMKYYFQNIEEVIQARLEQGWTYMGYGPVETRATGDIETLSRIFQRDDA